MLDQTPLEHLRRLARSEVVRKLGQGGFGSVYEVAMNSRENGGKDRKTFACKTIHIPKDSCEEVLERARNEISILQILDHPHIIKLAGACALTDRIFISTLPVADCNLKQFLDEQLPLISTAIKSQIWHATRGLGSALTYLHKFNEGVGFHADLKPENILVIKEFDQKTPQKFLLADFGSAKITTLSSSIGHGGQGVTPKYSAPEWLENNEERGTPSDVWAFGCILAQVVTCLHGKTVLDFETF
jgi:serine/threonine protein kinase